MPHRTSFSKRLLSFLPLSISVTVVGLLALVQLGGASGSGLLLSPLSAPSAPLGSPISTPAISSLLTSPISTPVPPLPRLSDAAQSVLDDISRREGIPADSVIVAADQTAQLPALDRMYQVVTLVDMRSEGQVYKVLVDLTTGEVAEDISAVMDADRQAQQIRYGKLQPALYERLQTLGDEEVVPVAVWVAAPPGQSLSELEMKAYGELAAKHPEARAAMERSRKPMDVDDPELSRHIYAEYFGMLDAAIAERVVPVVAELERHGFDVTTYESIPSIVASLPKHMIMRLSRRDDVSIIYLIDALEQPTMDTAVPTDQVPAVWARGVDGTGVTIAILENGNVDPNNSFLNLSPITRAAGNGITNHATRVSSVAASFHDTYKGVAPGATILSAGENGTEAGAVDGLQWALNQGAQVVNFSAALGYDDNMNWSDRAFDYWARHTYKTVVVAAGNSGGSLCSPGKGWNVITVGATDDSNTPGWSDDQMRFDSSWTNPVSFDREKPEVVAVGDDVTTLGLANVVAAGSGTSLAAPQVAGLAALLIDRYPTLEYYAETIRAIIMATAINNIDGPPVIAPGYGDLLDGAGAIHADLADRLAQSRSTATSTCFTSCWWASSITNSSFPLYADLEREFYAQEGDLIRIAIAWWSNPDGSGTDYAADRLDTDLDLRVKDPDEQYLPDGWSLSIENNYEIVQFRAPQNGFYTIRIHKAKADEYSNTLGVAFLRINMPYRSYVPLAMKNHP